MGFVLLMECLYCHKKFSSFRFWKGSEFCSKEHAEAYRTQTLSRLMDGGGGPDKPPLTIEDTLKTADGAHTPTVEYSGARRIEAPAASSPLLSTGRFELPPAGTHALEGDLRLSVPEPVSGGLGLDRPSIERVSGVATNDVGLQTPEEALNALRELARSAHAPSAPPMPQMDLLSVSVELPRAESMVSEAKDEVDADDVFAELRRMAAATGETGKPDEAGDRIDLPTAPEGLSALDRLMEAPTPRAGVGKPTLSRREGIEGRIVKPASPPVAAREETPVLAAKEEAPVIAAKEEVLTAAAAKVVEAEARVLREELPEPTASEAPPEPEKKPVPAKTEARVEAEEPVEKVVSFPGPKQAVGRESAGRKAGRMVRSRGGASGLFDSGIHDEMMPVDLSGLLREVSGLPAKSSAVALDGTLKMHANQSYGPSAVDLKPRGAISADWPAASNPLIIWPPAASLAPQAPTIAPDRDLREPRDVAFAPPRPKYVPPDRDLGPVGQWDNLLWTIVPRDLDGQPGFSIERRLEPSARGLEPHLPVGLAESMGVIPPNRGQLIRSELFIKEPEVREYRGEAWEAAPEADVRRVYYGNQGTA